MKFLCQALERDLASLHILQFTEMGWATTQRYKDNLQTSMDDPERCQLVNMMCVLRGCLLAESIPMPPGCRSLTHRVCQEVLMQLFTARQTGFVIPWPCCLVYDSAAALDGPSGRSLRQLQILGWQPQSLLVQQTMPLASRS